MSGIGNPENGGRRGNRKGFSRNNGPKCSKFYENYQSTDPRNLMNLKDKKYDENYINIHHNQIGQNQ